MKRNVATSKVRSAVDPHNPVAPPMIGLTEIALNGYSVDVRTLAENTVRPALILPHKRYFNSDIIILTIVSSSTSSGLEYDFLGWIDREGFDVLTTELSESEEVYIPVGLLYSLTRLQRLWAERSVRQGPPRNGETR
jgi:hypothetical protein